MLSGKAGANSGGDTSSSGVWQCPRCTFENPLAQYRCKMCHTDLSANGGATGAFNGAPSARNSGEKSLPLKDRDSPFTDRDLDFSTKSPRNELNEVWPMGRLLCTLYSTLN